MQNKEEFLGFLSKRSNKEISKALDVLRQAREGKWHRYGKDGIIEVWRKKYRYRGMEYEVACMQYFSFNEKDPLEATILDGINKYLILEYPNKYKIVHDFAWNFLNGEWLWKDTAHSEFSGSSVEEMEEWIHKVAKEDIDYAKDTLLKQLGQEIEKIQSLIGD